MNNKLLRSALALLPVLLLLLSGCNKMPQQEQKSYPVVSESAVLLRSGSGFEFQNTELNQDCLVGEKDLQAYLNYKRLIDENAWPDGDITPILDVTGEVVMYAVNYPEGWELIAADKRCPAVLASDRNGHFIFEEQIPPVQTWLTCTGEDVLNVREITSYDDIKDPEVIEKMQNNENFWKMITADKEYLKERMRTRLGPDPEGFDDGEWVPINFVIDTVSYQLVDHLVQTHWDQNPPYNNYCPFKSNSNIERTLAGCVAIAVGQVANYFHDLIGYPQTAPLTAYCDAVAPFYAEPGNQHMYVDNLSSSAWDDIPSNGNMCAKLVAEIGIDEHMHYTDYGSFTYISLPDYHIGETYFENKGFQFSTGVLNVTALSNNIVNEKPVIARAVDAVHGGHAFIIDAYEYAYIKCTNYYVWRPRIPEPGEQPTTSDFFYVTTKKVSMNWGWGPSYDNTWYNVSDDWSASIYTFGTSNRTMLYNLSVQ